MRLIIGRVLCALSFWYALAGCNGVSRTSAGADESGNAATNVVLELENTTWMMTVLTDGQKVGKAYGLNDADEVVDSAGSDIFLYWSYVDGERSQLNFQVPAKSKKVRFEIDRIPNRICTFSPNIVTLSEITAETRAKGKCKRGRSITIENLSAPLTLTSVFTDSYGDKETPYTINPGTDGESLVHDLVIEEERMSEQVLTIYREDFVDRDDRPVSQDPIPEALKDVWMRTYRNGSDAPVYVNAEFPITAVSAAIWAVKLKLDAGSGCQFVDEQGTKSSIWDISEKRHSTHFTELQDGKFTNSWLTTFYEILTVPHKIVCEPGSASSLVGGSVKNLHGSIVLQNNSGDDITVTSDAKADKSFTFNKALSNGSEYSISIKTQPAHQLCTVTDASKTGVASTDSPTAVAIDCVYKTYSVSGSVSGHTGALSLSLGDKTISLTSGDDSYSFSEVPALSAYAVEVDTHPAGQSCTVGAPGTASKLEGNVTNANITCSNETYNVSVNVSGVNGNLTLQLNSGNNLAITTAGNHSFTTSLAYNASYVVTVSSQPTHQVCTLSNATGNATANVSNVTVSCVDKEYTLSVTVSGLSGGTLRLRNQINLNDLDVTANGTFNFSQKITRNAAYDFDVRVRPGGQPAGQLCTLSGDVGTASGNVTVTASCVAAASTYTVGGDVIGLNMGESVDLLLTYGAGNTTEVLTVSGADFMGGATNFVFNADLADGDAWAVTISSDALAGGKNCSVDENDTGSISGADVTNVTVNCM